MTTNPRPRTAQNTVLLLALLGAGCGRDRDAPAPPAVSVAAPVMGSGSLMSIAPPVAVAPAASSAPVVEEVVTPEQRKARLKATTAEVREALRKDRCSPNQPVAIRGHDAVFFTFTCDHPVMPMQDVSLEGIAYLDWRNGKVVDDRGDDVSVESGPQGFLYKVEDGRVQVAVYRLLRGIFMSRLDPGPLAVQLVDGGWKDYTTTLPARVAEGRPLGPKDPTPIFPVEKSVALSVCPAGLCRAPSDWVTLKLGEVHEAWDGQKYSPYTASLKPHHEAKLRAVRRYADDYIAWRGRTALRRAAASASAAAAAAGSASAAAASAASAFAAAGVAAPVASPGSSGVNGTTGPGTATTAGASRVAGAGEAPASPLATWAASYGNPPPLDPALGAPTEPNPRASFDRRGCPVSLLHLAIDLYLYEQLTGVDEGNASGHAGALLHDFPFDRCTNTLAGSAEDYEWPQFKKRLEGMLPERRE